MYTIGHFRDFETCHVVALCSLHKGKTKNLELDHCYV